MAVSSGTDDHIGEKEQIKCKDKLTTKQNTIYHYTSLNGLLGIIKEKSIWASDIRYLNDSKEFSYTIELVSKLLNKKIDEDYSDLAEALILLDPSKIAPIYVASFSAIPDQLSQWRGYCPKVGGIMIGFDVDEIERSAKEQDFKLTECIYCKEAHKAKLNDIIDKALIQTNPTQSDDNNQNCDDLVKEVTKKTGQARLKLLFDLLKRAPTFKDPSFHEEREWRLVLDTNPSNTQEVMHREGKSMIVPCVEFKLPKDKKNKDQPLMIKEVMIGPTPHKELSRLSVHQLLKKNKISPCEVTLSKIPYRSW